MGNIVKLQWRTIKNGDLFNNRGLDGDEDSTLQTFVINIEKDFSIKMM